METKLWAAQNKMSLIENFLRRWSTTDITPDNGLLFDEHLMGVRILAAPEEQKFLANLTRSTARAEFALRWRNYKTLDVNDA